jgi:hypothetical protein
MSSVQLEASGWQGFCFESGEIQNFGRVLNVDSRSGLPRQDQSPLHPEFRANQRLGERSDRCRANRCPGRTVVSFSPSAARKEPRNLCRETRCEPFPRRRASPPAVLFPPQLRYESPKSKCARPLVRLELKGARESSRTTLAEYTASFAKPAHESSVLFSFSRTSIVTPLRPAQSPGIVASGVWTKVTPDRTAALRHR